MAFYPSIHAWRISWTEEPGRLQFMGSQRVRYDWATNTMKMQIVITKVVWPLLVTYIKGIYFPTLCLKIIDIIRV